MLGRGVGADGAERRTAPVLYGVGILAVFVVTVAVIAVKAGSSSAIVTAVVTVAVAGTAFGLWGASMAVKETAVPTSVPADDAGIEDVPASESQHSATS